jgi:hypothetical protein
MACSLESAPVCGCGLGDADLLHDFSLHQRTSSRPDSVEHWILAANERLVIGIRAPDVLVSAHRAWLGGREGLGGFHRKSNPDVRRRDSVTLAPIEVATLQTTRRPRPLLAARRY